MFERPLRTFYILMRALNLQVFVVINNVGQKVFLRLHKGFVFGHWHESEWAFSEILELIVCFPL